jgi:hypothetical protein
MPWSVSPVLVLVSTLLQVSPIFPTYPLGNYTCVFCLFGLVRLICSSQPVFFQLLFFPSLSFSWPPGLDPCLSWLRARQPDHYPVPLPLLWFTDLCLTWPFMPSCTFAPTLVYRPLPDLTLHAVLYLGPTTLDWPVVCLPCCYNKHCYFNIVWVLPKTWHI